ncbi:NUDIX hydrolase [Bifidobacterium sp. BRDM6]|uniref:NUDIX hydrolase n=1 Tax=Bifidobacterium choloepi TaxID=2614131 RepID=A0A6I5N801_9BIFI|nr:NUDIX hydrolase [Bifidobacterium choloepi]NEG69971.1 NUDIX hydrolase [Bifidobacterium choloepi]
MAKLAEAARQAGETEQATRAATKAATQPASQATAQSTPATPVTQPAPADHTREDIHTAMSDEFDGPVRRRVRRKPQHKATEFRAEAGPLAAAASSLPGSSARAGKHENATSHKLPGRELASEASLRVDATAPAVANGSRGGSSPTPSDVFVRRGAHAGVSRRGSVQTPKTAKAPTPAMMPRKRTSDRPATFASLDAQDLPVVREYSAGGLVFDDHGRVAIIARHSRSGHLEWCLPKGHIEKGETPQQTAVREVHEETGILGEVVDSIATIDYWFTGTSQRVHKLVHHFALRQVGGDLTVEGDPDHEAEDAIWVDFGDLDSVLSYPNERKIAWLYARKLNRQA